MLDNIGRRFLVEHADADDGSWEYDLYSDGFIVQRCTFSVANGSLTFPKAFRDLNYRISTSSLANKQQTDSTSPGGNYIWGWFGLAEKTTTGFKSGASLPDSSVIVDIVAQGFSA